MRASREGEGKATIEAEGKAILEKVKMVQFVMEESEKTRSAFM